MKWLIDTDVLSASSKSLPASKVGEWILSEADRADISVVSLAELTYGIELTPNSARKELLRAWLRRIRTDFADAVLGLDEPTLHEWKKLLAELKSRNRTLPCEDTLIAATARRHGLTVVTFNQRHFKETGVSTLDPRR